MGPEVLEFGAFRLDAQRGALAKAGVSVPLGARAMAILQLLADRQGECVTGTEIMARVWPGVFVEEANIRVHVSSLRRALGEGHGIVNHPGRGYALEHPVRRMAERAEASLPSPAAPLIGRRDDKTHLASLLLERRLVTVVGTGGIGKTSLALSVAQDSARTVSFVDLSPLSHAGQVAGRVAQALNLAASIHSARELAAALQGRQLLLLLDNCEHVLEGASALCEALLTESPGVRILATSREPLRVDGEETYRLSPLALPEEAETAASAPALRLLLDRAAANEPPYLPVSGQLPELIRLCHALDGVPLAIELAAAHLGPQGPTEVLERLSLYLTEPGSGALGRHRSLRATLDWSHDLLRPAERSLLMRLGVFRGAIAMRGVLAAGSAGQDSDENTEEGRPLEAEAVRSALAELIDKSLVIADLETEQPTYRLLDTMRAYASRKLQESPWGPHVRLCHATRVRERLAALQGADAAGYRLSERQRLLDDLRAALDWAFSPHADAAIGVKLVAEAGPFFMQMSLVGEFRDQANRALKALAAMPGGDRRAEMQLLGTMGTALYHAEGPGEAILAAHARALAIAEELGDMPARRRSLWGIWLHHFGQAQYARGLPYAEAYRACTPVAEDPLAVGDRCAGMSFTFLGRLEQARACAERVLMRPLPATGNVVGGFQFEPRPVTRAMLARILWLQGHADQARAAARESLEETLAGGHALSICFSLLIGHCFVAGMTGDLPGMRDGAAQLLEVARANSLPFWETHGLVIQRAAERRALGLTGEDGDLPLRLASSAAHREALSWLGLRLPDTAEIARAEPIWATPEILRLMAWRRPDADAAALLERGQALAREQGALAWELRLATTRMALRPGSAARSALARVLDRCNEGFDTADLVEAERML